ncbi:sigma 54-interacting transcriptional regulator [bacterium]|nr:sigma 54-interacting transcriptional regulator [bacterium]
MPGLSVKKEAKSLFKINLPPGIFKVGSAPDCDLSLHDQELSKNHFTLFLSADSARVKDKSGGKIFINQKSIGDEAMLHHGDSIKAGAWEFVFEARTQDDEDLRMEVSTRLSTQLTPHTAEAPTKIIKLADLGNQLLVEKPLLVLDEAGSVREVKILKNKITIGSREGVDVLLKDDYVSGKHCELKFTSSGIFLTDLKSTNGTYVNDTRVGDIGLKPDDIIRIGETKLTIRWKEQTEAILPVTDDFFMGMVGTTSVMKVLFGKIQKVAPTDLSVLIQGESGTGKELIAQSLYRLSTRSEKPYVILNCGAISANLIESELFGHEKGAFTGAISRHTGAFEQANGGTLFLDEIGELPLELQPKLLRVLENGTIRRVGGAEEIKVDVRIVAATHRNLTEKVKEGKFREDLFYRLHVIPLFVPPLRERVGDVLLLAEHFLSKQSGSYRKTLSFEARDKLISYPWPGNVRELRNVICRSMVYATQAQIMPQDIELLSVASPEPASSSFTPPPDHVALVEKQKILEVLREVQGNRTRAAEALGMARSTLFRRLRDYGLIAPDETE